MNPRTQQHASARTDDGDGSGEEDRRPKAEGNRPGAEDNCERPESKKPADDKKPGNEAPKISLIEKLRKRPWLIALLIGIVIVIIVAAVLWWLHARQYESTDDAFVDSRIVTISTQVSGYVSDVAVTDNQVVKAGVGLAHIDDRAYQAQLAQAKAQVDEAKATIANLDAQLDSQQTRIDQAEQQVEQAKAALTFAQQEYNRALDLAKTGNGTVQQKQQTQSTLQQSQANSAAAEANAIAARKQLVVLRTQRRGADAQLESAQAQQKIAETNLSYTNIVAPVDGRVTKLTAAKGTYAAPGQALMMFVPSDIWVTANFKETQLTRMKRGQTVDITVDAFPDRRFAGHIDSIQAGSGTAFSLLPAENATGNYVKVVQRVPVKIVFDRPPGVELGPGMSVVPTVKVR